MRVVGCKTKRRGRLGERADAEEGVRKHRSGKHFKAEFELAEIGGSRSVAFGTRRVCLTSCALATVESLE